MRLQEIVALALELGGWPWGLAFAPDMSTFVVAKWEKTAFIFDTQTGEQLFELPHTDELFDFAAYSPDGRYVLTSDTRGAAHLWNVTTGQEAARFLHSTSVSSVKSSSRGSAPTMMFFVFA